ncbi:hypothetical protein V8C86DRAFT_2452387 [Haematococcus lacustris]
MRLPSVASVLTIAGLGTLLHCTYLVIELRKTLKLSQELYEGLTPLLLLELLVGTLTSLLGSFLMAGPLRVAVSARHNRSSDVGSLRVDFMSFNTRSKAFTIPVK